MSIMTKTELNKLYADQLISVSVALKHSAGKYTFELNQPCTITVKRRNGTFNKLPVIGGEKFAASACYVGKRGDFIVVFKPIGATDYLSMEMKIADCYTHFDDFAEVMKEILPSNKVVEEMKTQEVTRQTNTYGEEFGSWA